MGGPNSFDDYQIGEQSLTNNNHTHMLKTTILSVFFSLETWYFLVEYSSLTVNIFIEYDEVMKEQNMLGRIVFEISDLKSNKNTRRQLECSKLPSAVAAGERIIRFPTDKIEIMFSWVLKSAFVAFT